MRESQRVAWEPVLLPAPWEGALIPVSGFPAPEDEARLLRQLVGEVARSLAQQWKLSSQVFIQLVPMLSGVGAPQVTENGRKWIPMPGLGVWPDREPPTLWTAEELWMLAPGQTPRPMMYQVMQVSVEESRDHARDVMLGLGTIVQMMTTGSADEILQKGRDSLLPPIKDPALTGFPLYMTLLEKKSLGGVSSDQLAAWLCGACVYIRESTEDQGILIISSKPLTALVESLAR